MESKIQSKIIKNLEQDGYFVLKLIKTNKNGIPDLLVIKDGKCFFVEVKTLKGIVSEIQKYRIQELQKFNTVTKIWTDYKIDK